MMDCSDCAMAAPYRVTAVYTKPMVRDAVCAYVWRRGVREQKGLWVLEAVLLAALAYASSLVPGWLDIVLTAAALLPPVFLALLWQAHHRNTAGKFRSMRAPQGEFVLGDDALSVRSDLGATELPWPRITEIWERPGYWMIFIGPAQFMLLPTANAPSGALAFLRAKAGAAH